MLAAGRAMSPDARRFYRRYYLLTRFLPAYVLALLSYIVAWLLGPRSPLFGPLSGSAFIGAGAFVFVGLSQLLAWLGFQISGVPAARVPPTELDAAKVRDASAGLPGAAVVGPVEVVELGLVPYAASGGTPVRQLWLSTHTLRTAPPQVLRALLAHEAGHSAAGGLGCAWQDLMWLLAYPVVYVLSAVPLLILVALALQVSLWLRLDYALRLRREASADRWAGAVIGRRIYAEGIERYLRDLDVSAGAPLRRTRLAGLGLTPGEIDEILDG
jgi:hypothetical protein